MAKPKPAVETPEEPKAATSGKKPVQEIRMGRIKAAIWQNETENGVRFNVTADKLYKDGNEWKTTTSFGRDDLPVVCKVLDRAHSWIFHKQQEHE